MYCLSKKEIMKKSFLKFLPFIGIIAFTISCNQPSGNNAGEHHDHDHNEAVASDSLSLDHGAKWTLDSTTLNNFNSLETTVDMFAVNPFPPIESYQEFGTDVSDVMSKMLKECTMTGEGHDMLHRWLTPILTQSNDLKTVQDTVLGRKLADSIHTRVGQFTTYFVATP